MHRMFQMSCETRGASQNITTSSVSTSPCFNGRKFVCFGVFAGLSSNVKCILNAVYVKAHNC